jgi:hypothetical protein
MYPRSTERHYLYASIRNLMQIVALRSLLDCLETEALRQCKHFGLIRVVDPCCSEVYRPACGCRPRPGLPANPVFGFEDKNRQAGSMDTTCSLQAAEASSHDDYVYRVAHVGRMVWCGRGCCGSSEHVGRGFGAEDLIFIRSSKTPDCSHQMCQLPTKPTQINSLHPFCSRASRETPSWNHPEFSILLTHGFRFQGLAIIQAPPLPDRCQTCHHGLSSAALNSPARPRTQPQNAQHTIGT